KMSTEDQIAPLSPKTSPATPTITPFTQRKESNSSSEDNRQDSWELVEDLQGLTENIQKPEKLEGLLLKKRKWPMKGWHKRYFLLERGILTYAKTGTDVSKGRLRGRIDVGLSVMAMKKKSMCIDLDTEDSIYHLKAKTRDLFEQWVTQLRHHRTFRQNEITMEPPELLLQSDPTANRRVFTLLIQDRVRNTLDCISEKVQATNLFICSVVIGNGSNCAVMRRDRLPSTRMNESVNLWSILRSNIGKDLSKVAMPVQLNEPLNTLQRLCEEVEYCHLLDTAANTHDPHMRMVYIAAFAVSAYACSFTRAGGKPFNPILGETYECLRQDKGFRFIAEQVSHHPPVSACHCESKNYTFGQDVRWKNKFWGKSMEIVPMGVTHLELFGDRYEWSKVTSCIHNILSGQRWIEHYGEMSIKHSTTTGDVSHCKVTFLKSRSGALNANEVEGMVTDSNGRVIHSLFGKWNEALYLGKPPSATCIWRANPMPEDHEQYYGFTQFAIELNELEEGLKPLLPLTDTRFRPDQRLLEEGDIAGAEEQKERIEVLQRERRRVLQENNITYSPRFFKRAEDDSWVSNGTYWDLRKDPGFSKLEIPVLW
uniref:Oxysterol-binding protein n=1 Tax=Cyprinus carpio TaxID=7962 RepID=A0A8C1TTN8_CYPCA